MRLLTSALLFGALAIQSISVSQAVVSEDSVGEGGAEDENKTLAGDSQNQPLIGAEGHDVDVEDSRRPNIDSQSLMERLKFDSNTPLISLGMQTARSVYGPSNRKNRGRKGRKQERRRDHHSHQHKHHHGRKHAIDGEKLGEELFGDNEDDKKRLAEELFGRDYEDLKNEHNQHGVSNATTDASSGETEASKSNDTQALQALKQEPTVEPVPTSVKEQTPHPRSYATQRVVIVCGGVALFLIFALFTVIMAMRQRCLHRYEDMKYRDAARNDIEDKIPLVENPMPMP